MGGEILIQSKYPSGPLAVIGTTYAHGALYIGYGVEDKGGTWLSTIPISLKRCVLIISSGKLQFGTASASAEIPIGEEVTLTFRDL